MFGCTQMIYSLIELILDHSAFTNRYGRFLNDRLVNQLINVLQSIDFFPDGCQLLFLKARQHRLDRRQHLQRVTKSDQISGVCRLISYFAEQSFQIVNRIQVLSDLVPGDGILIQFLDCIQTFLHFFLINQRLLNIVSQQSAAHGRLRLVQYPQQRPSLLLFPQCLCQFQISSGGTVQQHVFAGKIGRNMSKMFKIRLLGII